VDQCSKKRTRLSMKALNKNLGQHQWWKRWQSNFRWIKKCG